MPAGVSVSTNALDYNAAQVTRAWSLTVDLCVCLIKVSQSLARLEEHFSLRLTMRRYPCACTRTVCLLAPLTWRLPLSQPATLTPQFRLARPATQSLNPME
jgi:hypothetical protein